MSDDCPLPLLCHHLHLELLLLRPCDSQDNKVLPSTSAALIFIHTYEQVKHVVCLSNIFEFCLHIQKLPLKKPIRYEIFLSPKRWTVCCCMPLQWRGTSWNCRNSIYWEELKWAMSGRQASTALIVSVPLIHSGQATVHFYREHLPTHQSHVQTQHSSSDTMELYQPAMKLLFTIKPAAKWKKVHNRKRWMWSKIDLKYTLDGMRHNIQKTALLTMTQQLDFVTYSTHILETQLFSSLMQ